MKLKFQLLTGVAMVAGMATAMPAAAQTAGQTGSNAVETVVVTGVRASLESALAIKENSGEIVDSIVAEDIGKLPDTTVADALQRISGIQIKRDFGEGGAGQNQGSGIAIRGLQQVETTVNGHEVLTASGFRTYDVEDMPAEMVAGIDVYKSSAANLDEGGLGGLINIRTLKPFDFSGAEVVANASMNYGDLVGAARPSGSVLLSDRWSTSIGEMGALIDISYQDRAVREDYASAGSPSNNTLAIPGQTIVTPNGVYTSDFRASRPREGLNAAFQWRPSDRLEFYAEANDTRLATYQNQPTYTAGFGADTLVVPGTYTLFPGTNYMAKGSFGPIGPFAYYGFTSVMGARDSTEVNQDYTVGTKWHPTSDLNVTGSVNWQHSSYLLNVAYGLMEVGGETMNYDLTGPVPAVTFTGPDLTNLSNYNSGSISYTQQRYSAQNTAAKMDAQWVHKVGPFDEFDFGFRYSDHDAVYNQTGGYSVTAPNQTPSAYPNYFQLIDTGNFAGTIVQTTNFWVYKPDILRANFADEGVLFNAPQTPQFALTNRYGISERLTDGYAEAKMDLGSLDGNFGLRVVNTNRSATGTLSSGSTQTPITYHTDHTDVLPSMNLRFHFNDQLQLRFAASRTMTRPDFSAMNPDTVLISGSLSGYKGNINLPAMYASNYDISLEDYFAKGGAVFIDGFIKSVHNFPYSTTSQETFNGTVYTISEQLASTTGGTIKGFELGYSQFYDFLPGIWKGLGLQANYTYVDSTQPYYIGSKLTATTTLPNLSRHSFTIIGMYDLKPVSVRLAYTWRSNFLQALYTGLGGGNIPERQAPYGWLDGSVNYDVDDQFSVYLQGVNLLDTVQHTYFSYTYSPANYWKDGRQIIVGVRYKM